MDQINILVVDDEKEIADLFDTNGSDDVKDDDFDLTAALEKAAFVHDFIVLNCTYDVDTFNKYLRGDRFPSAENLEIIKEQLKQMENGDFTEEDIDNAKTIIKASVESIPESQDSEITYYFSQELSEEFVSIEEYIKNIEKVSKEQIVEIAKKIQINTIYFLKD